MKPPAKAKLKAAKKKAASSAKRPGSDRVKGTVLGGAISANEPLVGGAEEASGIERMFAILFFVLLFSLPVLLVIVALLKIVPESVAHGDDIRVPVALCGLFFLVIEGSMYLLIR